MKFSGRLVSELASKSLGVQKPARTTMDITDRLLSLRVDDVMAKNVVVISAGDTMARAADVFRKNGISAAPVVDASGQCVGILTASDFVRREQTLAQDHEGLPSPEAHHLAVNTDDGSIHMEGVFQDAASAFMSPAVQTVRSGSSLLAAARMMTTLHIHHLPIVDPQGRPIGMVSTLDITASLLNAVEEMKSSF